jgi:uncharacterized membrane protein YbaN (DUF454 family)
MTKWLWRTLGLLNVGFAYIGMITPGIPTTTFLLLALWCFSKGSPKLYNWLYTHRKFGYYIRNWSEKRIYPKKAKYMMLFFCMVSLLWMGLSGVSLLGIIGTALFMLFWLVWAWRYPSTEGEHFIRTIEGKRIGWLK